MLKLKSLLPFLGVALLLGACNTTPFSSGATPSIGTGTQGAKGQNHFAKLEELDYTPPKTEYLIGPSDLLDIKVFKADELSQEARVDPKGNIAMPLIGSVKAAGYDQFTLAKKIASSLGEKYLQNPQVTVSIKEFTNQRVTVEGEVKSAGVFPLEGDVTLLQAVALAGGLNNLADPSKTVLFRKVNNQNKAYNINLDAIRNGQARDPYVRNDDRIIVHRSNSRYWLREVGAILNPFRTFIPAVN